MLRGIYEFVSFEKGIGKNDGKEFGYVHVKDSETGDLTRFFINKVLYPSLLPVLQSFSMGDSLEIVCRHKFNFGNYEAVFVGFGDQDE